MARTVDGGTPGARLVALLAERTRCTQREAARLLGVREDRLARDVQRLVAQGVLVAERLGGETYLALSGVEVRLARLPPGDARRLRATRLPPPSPRDEQDPAFG